MDNRRLQYRAQVVHIKYCNCFGGSSSRSTAWPDDRASSQTASEKKRRPAATAGADPDEGNCVGPVRSRKALLRRPAWMRGGSATDATVAGILPVILEPSPHYPAAVSTILANRSDAANSSSKHYAKLPLPRLLAGRKTPRSINLIRAAPAHSKTGGKASPITMATADNGATVHSDVPTVPRQPRRQGTSPDCG